MKKSIATTILIVIAIFGMIGLATINPAKRNLNTTNSTTNQTDSVAGASKSQNSTPSSTTATKPSNLVISDQGKTIAYDGENPKTALELLKAKVQVETKDTSFGPQIMVINGIKSTDKEFWAFYVNGQPASVGAHQYQTKDEDRIEWKLTGM